MQFRDSNLLGQVPYLLIAIARNDQDTIDRMTRAEMFNKRPTLLARHIVETKSGRIAVINEEQALQARSDGRQGKFSVDYFIAICDPNTAAPDSST